MSINTISGNLLLPGKPTVKPLYVFISLWLILFLLYLPAIKAGWVSDAFEFLAGIKKATFFSFLNVKYSRGNLYQFPQSITWLFYSVFKDRSLPWLLLFISIHAANCTLIFVICKKLFKESGVRNGLQIVLGTVVLFCICPHLSEVIVWKVDFHYLQALLFMLIILYLVQKFLHNPRVKYAWIAGGLFFLSTFSHEFFYMTPFFLLTLIFHYRFALSVNATISKKAILYFVIPCFVLLIVHVFLVRATTGAFSGNLEDEIHQPLKGYLYKPASYIYHVVFMGRYFSHTDKQMIYDFLGSTKGIALFWGVLALAWLGIILRFKKMTQASKTVVMIFAWLHFAIAIVCPVWFPNILLVNFDRYTYYMLPFIYLLMMFVFVNIRIREWGITFFIIYSLINILLTIRINKYWGQSARIIDSLVHHVPRSSNKIVLVLNLPGNMNGIPMIDPNHHFSFKQVYNFYNDQQINSEMFDVVSYNMSEPGDGAHVNVYGDSLMHVTLNQWGTWWWRGMWGAVSYENEYYKVNMIDMGHWYELTLKRPANEYLLLYNVGDQWKVADWNKKNDDQN